MKIQYVRLYMQRVIDPVQFTSQHRPCEINLSLWINENESFIENNEKDWEWFLLSRTVGD